MKANTPFILIFLMTICVASMWADDTKSCDEYYFSCTIWGNHTLEYSVVGWQPVEEPHVDSVWITDAYNTTVLLVSYAQPHERIDIAFLPTGRYVCFAQVGECTFGRVFLTRNGPPPTDVENTPPANEQSNSNKYLRGNRLLIRQGKTLYDIQGRKM